MARRSIVTFKNEPISLDSYADYVLLCFKEPCSFVEIYQKNGTFKRSVNIERQLNMYGLKLTSLLKVQFPRMRWSDRKLEEFARQMKVALLKKFIVIGECRQKQKGDQGD